MARKTKLKKPKARKKPKKKRITRPKVTKKPKVAKKAVRPLKKIEEPKGIHKTKIKIIGIGGGGGSIISEIGLKIKKVKFAVANTDLQALKTVSRGVDRFQFGQSLTGGLGTGMNSDLGLEAALAEKERIKKLLEGQDLCILVACLGGGTGSGAAPVFAKIAKNLGVMTYGIFTLPFKFEGEKKMEIARVSLQKLKPNLNTLSIIPNERIFQVIDKNTPLKEALSAINKILAEGLEGLIETIYLPGLINIDFADLKTVLEGRGRLAYLNTIETSGTSPLEEEIKRIISSPLYPYSIQGAKGVLFNIAGEKNIELAEINHISKTIFNLVNKEAKIIFGISQTRPSFSRKNLGGQSKKYRNRMKITLLATGCGARLSPQLTLQAKPKPKRKKRPAKKRIPLTLPKIVKLKPEEKKEVPKKEPKLESKLQRIKKKIKPKTSLLPKPKRKKSSTSLASRPVEEKVRKNALQLKREAEAEEEEMLKQERQWESPAFLRKRKEKPV